MTKQKHTPLPWHYNKHHVFFSGSKGGFSLYGCPEPDANAEFIVKACNSYYTTRRDTLLEVAGLARTKDRTYKALNSEAFEKFAQELERLAKDGK